MYHGASVGGANNQVSLLQLLPVPPHGEGQDKVYRCIQSYGITFSSSPLIGTEVGSCLMKNQSWAPALFFPG